MDPVKLRMGSRRKNICISGKIENTEPAVYFSRRSEYRKRANRNPYAAPGRGRCQQWCGTGRSQRCSFDSEIYLSRKALLRSRKV